MAKPKLLTWGELRDMVGGMPIEEAESPVLLCSDDGYVGVRRGAVRKVPDNVDATDYVLGGIREKDVKPGRIFIQL